MKQEIYFLTIFAGLFASSLTANAATILEATTSARGVVGMPDSLATRSEATENADTSTLIDGQPFDNNVSSDSQIVGVGGSLSRGSASIDYEAGALKAFAVVAPTSASASASI